MSPAPDIVQRREAREYGLNCGRCLHESPKYPVAADDTVALRIARVVALAANEEDEDEEAEESGP